MRTRNHPSVLYIQPAAPETDPAELGTTFGYLGLGTRLGWGLVGAVCIDSEFDDE